MFWYSDTGAGLSQSLSQGNILLYNQKLLSFWCQPNGIGYRQKLKLVHRICQFDRFSFQSAPTLSAFWLILKSELYGYKNNWPISEQILTCHATLWANLSKYAQATGNLEFIKYIANTWRTDDLKIPRFSLFPMTPNLMTSLSGNSVTKYFCIKNNSRNDNVQGWRPKMLYVDMVLTP